MVASAPTGERHLYCSARRCSVSWRFLQTFEILPDSVEAMILIGYLESVEGHAAKADQSYEKAVAADPHLLRASQTDRSR